MLDYLRHVCTLTLRDAIRQLREEDAKERDVATQFSPEVERSMTAHDAVHVIFACDTSDRGEALAHAWMMLGTTVTHQDLRLVMAGRDHTGIIRDIGGRRRLAAHAKAQPAIVAPAFRARHMRRRWSWTDYDRYLDTPLAAIREEYGVRLPRAGA